MDELAKKQARSTFSTFPSHLTAAMKRAAVVEQWTPDAWVWEVNIVKAFLKDHGESFADELVKVYDGIVEGECYWPPAHEYWRKSPSKTNP